MFKIPFCKTTLGEEEKKAICDVIDSGWVVMGKKTQEFEEAFAQYVGGQHAVFVDSGTAALDLSVKWLKKKKIFKKKDKIGVPSLTFTSTVEVVVNNGLKPQFLDVNKKNLCLQQDVLSGGIPVHLIGNRCLSHSWVYDSAHRIQKGDVKGSLALWCYSFYATKNMSTVNGGMIVTNDIKVAVWLRKARDHGISKGTTERYKDGQWAYSIDFVGWREKADDLRAAIGIEQLKKLPGFNLERERVVMLYNQLLGLNRTGLHLYPILVEDRTRFIEFMKGRGIQCSVHFLPLHRMPAYKKYAVGADLPNTEYLGDRLVSLPLFHSLTNQEVAEVVAAVKESGLFIHE